MVQKMSGSQVQTETRSLYNGSEEVEDVRILHRIFWSFNPCIRVFKYCKPLVQVDGTHLYKNINVAFWLQLHKMEIKT
ncbi:hypothetical protein Ahy_A05g025006 [Arachis hypogaea]|uniref:Uncharacterized protein n=1 Tax=Arachis hypogaea TaxID=3818 RepID=A0A445D7F7_ARAHY|nr:hypothetical protein Ahy_A05g025006 [Arachis hypogaea]